MTYEELIEYKRRTGYTTAQIAEKTSIPVGTLNKLFSGVTKNPRRDTILALERFFLEDDGWIGKRGDVYYENSSSGSLFVHQGSALEELNWKPQGTYTIEDYKNMPEGSRVELIDGCMYMMGSPTFTHQIMVQEVYEQIKEYITKKKGKCYVSNMSIDVYLTEDENTVVVPDLFILCDKSKMKEDGVHGAPDFVLEVLSKSTKGKDKVIKTVKYSDAGVREQWLIDPVGKKLYSYDNSMGSTMLAEIRPLSGNKEVKIYNGDLVIDLDKVATAAESFFD